MRCVSLCNTFRVHLNVSSNAFLRMLGSNEMRGMAFWYRDKSDFGVIFKIEGSTATLCVLLQ